MGETVNGIVFIMLAGTALLGAVGMLITRSVVHAAFWLLLTMVAVGGLYLLLQAEFLAVVQVLIYAGAVSVLMLFVIMLTLRRREDSVRPVEHSLVGGVMALTFCGVLFAAIARYGDRVVLMPDAAPGVAAFGQILYTRWVLPFEVASLVLLVAIIAAVWWSREEKR